MPRIRRTNHSSFDKIHLQTESIPLLENCVCKYLSTSCRRRWPRENGNEWLGLINTMSVTRKLEWQIKEQCEWPSRIQISNKANSWTNRKLWLWRNSEGFPCWHVPVLNLVMLWRWWCDTKSNLIQYPNERNSGCHHNYNQELWLCFMDGSPDFKVWKLLSEINYLHKNACWFLTLLGLNTIIQ